MGYCRVKVNIDSQEVLRLLANLNCSSHQHLALVADIQALLAKEWSVYLGHTLQEGNARTDHLAKQGASQREAWREWRDPSPCISLSS